MDGYGDYFAGGGRLTDQRILLRTIVQSGQHTEMSAEQGKLLAHVDYPGRIKNPEHQKNDEAEAEEQDDQGRRRL